MSQVNISDIVLSQLKIAKSGRMIKLMYNKEPLQLVTGKMYTPFGVKVNTNNYSSFTNCTLDCSLNQSNSEVSVKYRESLEALDQRITELIQESLHLFNTDTNYTPEDIPNIYGPILRENKTFPKLMKITLPRDSKGNFDYVVFNENKEKVSITDDDKLTEVLCKGKIFKGIIECGKIWYFKGRFGTTWNLKQLKFVENVIIENPIVSSQSTSQVYMMLDD
jgi:hypothetical protein